MTGAQAGPPRTNESRASERALENSETEFTGRYAQYAASGLLYPQREGSPLMEFMSAGRVLYLFDRTGPYTAQPGEARVIVHGILDPGRLELLEASADGESLTVSGVSAVEGVGRVLHVTRRTWVVQARLPLVLSGFETLPDVLPGEWVRFATQPPLHGFLAE
ncbi:hypothetical protein [Deinococcus sp.]|uniref:hypothetical protein n=1 Tax=Deinococcus sp. TaxID=47478 RepID=UPI0025B87C3B|nr:hypothetical protein [Deinococcus sp.]